MKIKNNIIFSIIVTLIWILFVLWNRFLRSRLPRIIAPIDIWSIPFLFVVFLFLISLIITFYYLLRNLGIIPRPNSQFFKIKNKIISYLETKSWFCSITFFINKHITNGPQNVYENIIYKRVPLGDFINFIGAKLSYHFQESPVIPYILGFVLPKIIPWVIFFLEIIFMHTINLFYKALVLLLIPLVLSILLYMINHHSKNSIDWYEPYFDFEYKDDNILLYFKKPADSTKEYLEKQEYLSENAGDNWFFHQNLYSISYKVKTKKDTYNYKVIVIVYALISIDLFVCLLILAGII